MICSTVTRNTEGCLLIRQKENLRLQQKNSRFHFRAFINTNNEFGSNKNECLVEFGQKN